MEAESNEMLRRRAFTIVELLTVVAVIVLLVGLLVVVLSSSAKAAQTASTRSLMGTLTNAITQFKADLGYLPPILGAAPSGGSLPGSAGYLRDLLIPQSSIGPALPQQVPAQQYVSMTSLVEYLTGPGGRNEDGFGGVGTPAANSAGSKELPAVGIRSPLKDGAWGAYVTPLNSTQPLGTFAQRNLPPNTPDPNISTAPNVSGRSFGPYLELKEGTIFGAIVGTLPNGAPIVARPGDNNWDELSPKCIVDYWGQPIRYYRRGYFNGDPRLTAGRSSGGSGGAGMGWDLSDIFVLRPQSFVTGTEVDGLADGNNDPTSSRALQGADFALMSMGPDRSADFGRRVDEAGFNADNVVEVSK